jgi:5-hydroxyisourate hydrolase-like protein (transthyretin family)
MNKTITMVIFAATLFGARGADGWMSSGSDDAYPRELYFVGVGMSERGPEEARTQAIVEVRKQISVTVRARLVDRQTSVTENGNEVSSSSVDSRARLSTSGDARGVEVVKTAEKDGVYYALAVLDKQNFAAHCKTRIAESKAALESRMSAARAALKNGEIGAALKELGAARKALREIHEQRKLLSAAARLGEQEQVAYTEADIDQLAEKCIASVTADIVSGNRQEVAAGDEPAFPLVVEIKAGATPAPMIPVELVDEDEAVLLTHYTDDNGRVRFELGEHTVAEIGTHRLYARIGLKVSASARKALDAQTRRFSYTVNAKPVHVAVKVNASGDLAGDADALRKKIVRRLAKYNIMEYPQSCFRLSADISANETGRVEGISAARTFVKTEVDVDFSLQDAQQRQMLSFTAGGKGTGSTLAKSVAAALGELRIKTSAARLVDAIAAAPAQNCAAAPAAPQASRPPAAPAPRASAAPVSSSGDGSNPEQAVFLPADDTWRKNTYINSEKWFYFNAKANGTYLLYVDSDKNNKTGAYSAWSTRLTVYREDLLDELDYSGAGSHYLTDPYTINTPVAEKVYLKVYGYTKEKNATFGAKFVER